MTNYILTRLLYSEDEVIFTFITSLLKRESVSESYYWAYELYYSGIDIFPLFWKIYFDFYAVHNPKLGGYIKEKEDAWKIDKNMKHIAYIVRNIFRLEPTSKVFILRQFLASGGLPDRIYRGRRPTWLHEYDKAYHNLLLSINKGHLHNAVYNMKIIFKSTSSDELHSILMKYYSGRDDSIDINNAEEYWKTHAHHYDFHCLIAIIVHMTVPRKDVNTRSLFIAPTETDMEAIRWIADEPISEERAYKTFRRKRLYPIRPTIGSFPLSRFGFKDFKQETFWHWEYYATTGCPIWNERLDRFSGTLDHENKKIVFPDEDNEDAFYEKYGFDFDEQPKDIQYMSLVDIEKTDWNVWYYSIFDGAPIIDLPIGFSYLY
jgi:hypothetical protein